MEDSYKWTLLALAVLAAVLFLAWPHPAPPADEGPLVQSPAVSLTLTPSPAYEGQGVRVQAVLAPECPDASGLHLSLDGRPLAFRVSDGRLEASFVPASGTHRVQLSGRSCAAAAVLQVTAAPCAGGTNRTCADSRGCAGQSVCTGGVWSVCRLPERICDPGARIPCSTDSCHWGFSICNSCGTAWGECLPPA
ncbi:Uncharacterised protein [uncultured archaeon]|nr:Uncharacterised protein [uncultured archaeon]